jgi:murein DD-endopeptidase MepM/ murein hydrolase activator NlpD
MEIISYRAPLTAEARHVQQFPHTQRVNISTVADFLPEEQTTPLNARPQHFRVRKIKPKDRQILQPTLQKIREFWPLFVLILTSATIAFGALYYDAQKPVFAETVVLEPFSFSEEQFLDAEMIRFTLPATDAATLAEGTANREFVEFIYTNPISYSTYIVERGDTISDIAHQFSLKNLSSLIGVNNIENVRQLRAGDRLTIPSMDGILYEIKSGDTIAGLSTRFKITVEDILDVNDLTSQTINEGSKLFIPGAQLDDETLKKTLNTLFVSPLVAWRLTSPVGYRHDPINGQRSYHNGLDMAAPMGSPIYAAMGGVISFAGYSNLYGNYAIINHGNGYQTLYGHMKQTLVRNGQRVVQGEKIGLVGMTGRVTGAHLHFTVYKNGKVIDPSELLSD